MISYKNRKGFLRSLILIYLFFSGAYLTVIGVGMLGFYGAGIILLWPGVLTLVYSISVNKNASWQPHLAIIIANVIFFLFAMTWYGYYLSCLYPVTAQNHCQAWTNQFLNFSSIITGGIFFIAVIRLIFIKNLNLRAFLTQTYSFPVIFALMWALIIGYVVARTI